MSCKLQRSTASKYFGVQFKSKSISVGVTSRDLLWAQVPHIICIQWNLSNTDNLGTKIIVLISEVSFFQGKNNMHLYKVGTQLSVLIKQGVLILYFRGVL